MPSAVVLKSIPYTPDSADWFNHIRHLPSPVWLDSGQPYGSYGRYDIISAAPSIEFITRDKNTTVKKPDGTVQLFFSNPFDLLKLFLKMPTETTANIPFCGGLLGYFGYDMGRHLEVMPAIATADVLLPDMHTGIYPWALIQDHQLQVAWLVINQSLEPTYNFLEIEQICANVIKNGMFHDLKLSLQKNTNLFKINSFKANINVEEYQAAFHQIHSYIEAGDCYQVNFAQRFSADFDGDPFVAYTRLRRSLPSPFSAFMHVEGGAILSLSPERFIRLKERLVDTSPIKGTIRRGKTADEDAKNANILLSSSKDRAENVMIVDLLRNDLSKTCSEVNVPELFGLQSFANVHHLVSTVTGVLNKDKNAVDVLASSFPGGSITGAPKIRAMEIIEELESTRRSVYCGSIGYISACGNMDTNIAIRTLVCDGNKIYCWGGGGIVADSEANKEYEESIEKVRLLMTTLEKEFGKKI